MADCRRGERRLSSSQGRGLRTVKLPGEVRKVHECLATVGRSQLDHHNSRSGRGSYRWSGDAPQSWRRDETGPSPRGCEERVGGRHPVTLGQAPKGSRPQHHETEVHRKMRQYRPDRSRRAFVAAHLTRRSTR